jgi:phage terminase small subunit
MPLLENPQHEAFVQELVKGKGQGEAYLAAGYNAKSVSVASAAATRLLKDVKIQKRLEELQSRAETQSMLTLDDHMEELRKLRDMAAAEGKYSAAVTAEVKRGELRRFYVKQVETGAAGEFSQASDEELDAIIAAELEARAAARRTKH